VDDDFAESVKTGTKVYAKIDDQELTGFIGSVNPVIRDRQIDFDVNLQESNHYKLRPNRTVVLEIVRAERDSVLRVPNGPVFARGSESELYVLTQGGARVSKVLTGLKTPDYVEITEGLEEGDRVVLSVISSIEDLKEMEIK
jgi:HlyD family secretion protein